MDGPKIIDWYNATSGDPFADAAINVIIFTLCNNPPETPRIINVITKILAKHIKKIYLNKYLLLSNKAPEKIHKWLLSATVLRLSYNLPEEKKTDVYS